MVEPTDIVQLNQRGRVFLAIVRSVPLAGRFAIEPVERGMAARSAHVSDIAGRWQKTPGPESADRGQLTLDVGVAT